MHYTYNKKIKITAILLLLVFTATAMADDVNATIEKALKFGQDDAKYGQIKLNLRYRYDNTNSTNPKKQVANASTVRYRLGYLTPTFKGLQAYAELQGSQDIGINSYNSTMNGKNQYEIISDPQKIELNQLWLSYKGIPNTEARLGRQNITLDNGRFIATSSWRQLARTFDAFLLSNVSLPNTTVVLGYINKIKNINTSLNSMQLPLVNISYRFADIGKLTGYAYLMDFRDPYLYLSSNQSYGMRLEGSRKINDTVGFVYMAEYTNQRNYKNSTPYQVDYYHVIGGVSAFGFIVKGAMEQLGGNGLNKTFNAPIGLLNKFNGWADLFITTPSDGLRDIYTSVDKNIMGLKLSGVFHDFSDDTGQKHYGDEWNFMVAKELFKHYTLIAKYAYYHADTAGKEIGKFDTQKIWLIGDINF
ncbi:alginate export family protein [Methylobacter sp. G7]|uniref:alginate export family protein n=1 Tax=Methylobacter sp. G7 TaxID=3230117 RepID=UPI003D8031A0